MAEALPIMLIPGLTCSARLYAEQIPALWRFGPVMVADHTRDDSMAAIARRILAAAPPRFALAGLSMGGYIAFEILRQAPERVAKLALLDTGARAETPEQTERRKAPSRSPRVAAIPKSRHCLSTLRSSQPPQRHGVKATRADDGAGDRRRSIPAPAASDHEPAGFAARPCRDQVSDACSCWRWR